MSTTTPTAIEKIKSNLLEYWPHWNLGRLEYFQKDHVLGNAYIEPWTHTQEMAEHEELRSLVEATSRFVPAGNYVRLNLFQKSYRRNPNDGPVWETVMSDTPDEMNDHEDVLANAEGRVLIHGLGLGCVLNCLIHNPRVTHIDVVESNPDVIALLLPYYGTLNESYYRVTVHLDSCVEKKWPPGTRWNYVWHDIWSTICPSNLRQEPEAIQDAMGNETTYDGPEHGISYERLHRMFQNRCDRQGAWGYEQARWIRNVERFERKYAARFAKIWNLANFTTRMDLLVDISAPSGLDSDVWIKFLKHPLNEGGNSILAQMKETAKWDISMEQARMMLGDRLIRYARSTIKSCR